MIEFLFGTLIQILIIQTDINDYFDVTKWDLRFWKYAFLTGVICHSYFQIITTANCVFAMLLFFYAILTMNMVMLRKEDNRIKIKDIVRAKILMNYIYIGISNMLFGFFYLRIFDEKITDIYEMTLLFYLLAIPSYVAIITIRKVVKKYVKNQNELKDVSGNCISNDACGDSYGSLNESNTIHLAQRFARFEQRRRNIAILNLAGYGALLFISNATGTLRFYIGFIISISLIRYVVEPILIKNGYFIKHCDAWKDCFSSTHLLYFIALYFCIQSNYDIAVLMTMAGIANFETVRRQDNV